MILMSLNRKSEPSLFSSDDERWDAVVHRDPSADGAFYYSVRTTGVYCRPSCAARLARRENVRFHPTCEAAEQAGFRPCKRCRPNAPALNEQRAAAVAKACRLIEASDESLNLEALADAVGMSRFHFHRVFKSITGLTPKAYASSHRAQKVRNELAQRDTVTEAIRVASAERSSVLSPFVPVRLSLLHENMLNAARAVPTPRDSMRFMS